MEKGKAPAACIFLISLILLPVIFSSLCIAGHRTVCARERGGKEVDRMEANRLDEHEGRYLLAVARKAIEGRLFDRKSGSADEAPFSPRFSERRGTFVTLTIDGCLRGCIGHIIPHETLIEGIKVNAINAAFRDPRFNPLTKEEWDKVKIEISILSEPQPCPYSDATELLNKLQPGRDGVIIKKGRAQATFLPQVWEQLPDQKEFLTHLCSKAGLDGNAWKRDPLEVSTYQVQAFEEE